MRLICLGLSLVILFATTRVLSNPSYLIITQPTKGTQWMNNGTQYITWTQGLGQGIGTFDVELARLSSTGLQYVAQNVPSTAPFLAVSVADIPTGDDYFVVFMNSSHGITHAISQRFSILPADQSASGSGSVIQPSVKNGERLLATVTLSGAPNPTSSFAYTFPPSSGARGAWTACNIGIVCAAITVTLWTML